MEICSIAQDYSQMGFHLSFTIKVVVTSLELVLCRESWNPGCAVSHSRKLDIVKGTKESKDRSNRMQL